jgi:hypothetical protein
MSSTQNYDSWGETIGNQYVDIESVDYFPFHNQWRGQPLSSRPYIRPNRAGWYPYNKVERVVKKVPEKPWLYAYYYPCSTIYPMNPQYAATKEIILER